MNKDTDAKSQRFAKTLQHNLNQECYFSKMFDNNFRYSLHQYSHDLYTKTRIGAEIQYRKMHLKLKKKCTPLPETGVKKYTAYAKP